MSARSESGSGDDEDREASERGRYLARKHGLRDTHARALAYRELGYSASGVAPKVDSTESSVKTWLDRIAVRHGLAAVDTKWSEQRESPLDNPTTESLRELGPAVLGDYVELAQDHPGEIPEGVDPYELEETVVDYAHAVRAGREEAPENVNIDRLAALDGGWYE